MPDGNVIDRLLAQVRNVFTLSVFCSKEYPLSRMDNVYFCSAIYNFNIYIQYYMLCNSVTTTSGKYFIG
jgi:ubiquitin-protein ligase